MKLSAAILGRRHGGEESKKACMEPIHIAWTDHAATNAHPESRPPFNSVSSLDFGSARE